MVTVAVPVLILIVVVSLTITSLYLTWRRRNGNEGNAPEIYNNIINNKLLIIRLLIVQIEDQTVKNTLCQLDHNTWNHNHTVTVQLLSTFDFIMEFRIPEFVCSACFYYML